MKVVGEADVADILIDDPQTIWKITKKESGIEKDFFDILNALLDKEADELMNAQKYERGLT